MDIQTVCVCGAGTMGKGIAQVAAQAGFSTILYEFNPIVLEQAKKDIENNLVSLVEKGKLGRAEKDSIVEKLRFTNNIESCNADLFIEAIIEDHDKKVDLFNQLASVNKAEPIFATNTSSLSVTSLAKQVKKPGKLIGLHFFNPAQVMKLVEVVNTPFTETEINAAILEFCKRSGKTAVICKDAPGFIVNRVARPYYIESLRIAEETAAVEHNYLQTDRIMESCGFKMGPFKLMDLIGNDINYTVSCSVYEQLKQPERLKPSFIQAKKVEKGELGRKTKRGYYNY